MNQDELKGILNNPAVSAEQRHALQRGGVTSDPFSVHEQTASMLRAFAKERIEDLTDADFQKYIARNGNSYSDPVIAESANWICPDETWLRLLGWDERGWWNNVLAKAVVAGRADVAANARRELAALP